MNRLARVSVFGGLLVILSPIVGRAQERGGSPIPESSAQMILVVAQSFDVSGGVLHRYERDSDSGGWVQLGGGIPIALGRNGLGVGIGLHDFEPGDMPVKKEGDGKSPAGVFRLSSAFGYSTSEQMGRLDIPYTHVTDRLECVDDVNSVHYNQIVLRDAVESVDWQSSESMLMAGPWYETDIVVDHNADPIRSGAGSCIFLHNWSDPSDTTAGCTSMAPSALTEIVRWIDSGKDPVLVQLTEQLYDENRRSWSLPVLSPIND